MIKDNKLKLCRCEEVAEPRQDRSKRAFTLAEVLITLGIIGVVAAMTIPTLMKNYQRRILKVRFTQTVAIINQAIKLAKLDLDVDSLNSYCTQYSTSYYNAKTCSDSINKNLKFGSNEVKYYNLHADVKRTGIKTFNGKNTVNAALANCDVNYTKKVQNGSYMNYFPSGYVYNISIDVNGESGPNKFGHDVFCFYLDNNDVLHGWRPNGAVVSDDEYAEMLASDNPEYMANSKGYPCNLSSSQRGNGMGCGYYALQNKCPWDDTKTYWECLP